MAETNKEKETSAVNNEMLSEILEGMKSMKEENSALKAQLEEMSKQMIADGNDDIVSTERKPAETIELIVIDGKPLIDLKLEPEMDTNHKGEEFIKRMQATCTVFGKDKPVKLSYGELSNPKDFLNLPRRKFNLIDRDESDLSGASKIMRGQTVDNFGKTAEIDRSSGMPIRTGKMVELVTKRDVRYYTVDVDGEKCELREDKIYR